MPRFGSRRPLYAVRRAGRAVSLLLAIGTSVGFAVNADARVFDPRTFTLDNGLQVVVVSDHRVPVVSHMIWYKVGAADEARGHTGIAHFLEHLMFKGTATVPQGEFSRIVARNGGQENAFTSYDYTAFFQNIARDRLELVMRMEADRMTNLTLTQAQVAPEKEVVLEERRMRVDNDPAALLAEEAQAARFLNYPYHHPIIGWESDVAALQLDDVVAFYRQWYSPAAAVLVVTGDITEEELRPMALRTYGQIKPADVPERLHVKEPAPRAERRVTLQDDRVRQPSLTRSWLAPSYRYGDTQRAYPLQIVADILGGGSTSRLYQSLVVEQSLAVAAGAYYDPTQRGPATVVIYASPRTGVDLDRLGSAIETVVGEMLGSGVTAEEVQASKQRLAAEAIYARDSYSTAARVIGEALAIGQTIEDVEAWPERIDAVDLAQVNAAARLILAQPDVTSLLLAGEEVAATDAASTAPVSVPLSGPVR
jgi:zinc protease